MRRKAKNLQRKKLILVQPSSNEGHEERSLLVCRAISNDRQLKMFLMDGDCGNVTHLKTHCVRRATGAADQSPV